jgi:hypothetical protein
MGNEKTSNYDIGITTLLIAKTFILIEILFVK